MKYKVKVLAILRPKIVNDITCLVQYCLMLLQVGYNEFREEGGYVIVVAVDRNEEGPLKHINFGVSIKSTIVKMK